MSPLLVLVAALGFALWLWSHASTLWGLFCGLWSRRVGRGPPAIAKAFGRGPLSSQDGLYRESFASIPERASEPAAPTWRSPPA